MSKKLIKFTENLYFFYIFFLQRALYLLLLIVEHPLNNLEDCHMIIADLDFVSDIEEFENKIDGGARASTYTATTVGNGYASARGSASASGDTTRTNVDNRALVKENSYSSYNRADSSANAYARDRNSSASSSSRNTSVLLVAGRP